MFSSKGHTHTKGKTVGSGDSWVHKMNKPMMPNRLNKEGGKEGGGREGRAKDPWLSKVHSN